MDIKQDAAHLKYLQTLVARAAPAEANAMGQRFQTRVKLTLSEVAHPAGIFWKAPPGRPPAYASGVLRESIVLVSAYGSSVSASSSVYALAIYAALQEYGGSTWPNRSRYMHWVNSAGPWWKKRVTVPEHPYMRPSLEACIRDGSLTGSAMVAFERATFAAYI